MFVLHFPCFDKADEYFVNQTFCSDYVQLHIESWDVKRCYMMKCCFLGIIPRFLSRRTKTRSFDNLPSACELGSSLAPNRRSSDPSLNEKWQDHRRSLELNMAVGSEGGGNQDQEVRPNGVGPYADGADSELDDSPQSQDSHAELKQGASVGQAEAEEEAELSVAVGVAEGQMENILQEATKEEAVVDVQREGGAVVTQVMHTVDTNVEKEAKEEEEDQCAQVNGTEIQREACANGHHPENGIIEAKDGESPPLPTEEAEELQQAAELTQTPDDLVTQTVENSSVREEPAHGPCESSSGESEQPAAHRTITNGFVDRSPEEPGVEKETCPDSEPDRDVLEPGQQLDKRASLMESSTETLTEEACSRLELAAQLSVCPSRQPPCPRKEKALEAGEHGFIRTLNGGSKRPSVSAFQSASADLSRDGLCNGDSSEGEPCGGPHWAKVGGERAPLSRQVSLASCNSFIFHPRGSCSQHRWCHSLCRVAISPEQPSRSHLDDDGLTLHTDAIQQRLRQIEAGHQMEVETLKKQVQELWSRLENQHHVGSHRINGDMGDELVRWRRGSP